MKEYIPNIDVKKIQNIYQLLNDGKYRIALREIKSYMQRFPQDDLGLLTYADCLSQMTIHKMGATSNYQEIEDICLQVIDKESKFKGSAYEMLGNLKVVQKEMTEAEIYYKKAMELGNDRVINSLISILLTNQKNQEALETINRIEPSSDDVELLLHKSALLYHLDQYKEGLEVVTQIDVSLLTKPVLLYYYTRTKARLYMALDKNKEAEEVLEDYRKQSSIYNKNYCLLVDCYLRRKKVKEAYFLCQDIMENANNKVKLYTRFSLGNIYRELGNFDKAKEEYLKATNPNNNQGKIFNSYIALGELALIEKDYQQARNYFQKLDGSNPKVKVRKAVFLAITDLKTQNVSKAYQKLSKIDVHKIPVDLRSLYQHTKAIVMQKMGKEVEGEDYFSRQLTQYSKRAAMRHIQKYHTNDTNLSFLDKSIPVYSFLKKVPDLL